LTELAKTTKFSDKYLNLLARNGKLEAHREGRNRLTTKEALKNYLEERERMR
jgi:excisionase family DNA binding protein